LKQNTIQVKDHYLLIFLNPRRRVLFLSAIWIFEIPNRNGISCTLIEQLPRFTSSSHLSTLPIGGAQLHPPETLHLDSRLIFSFNRLFLWNAPDLIQIKYNERNIRISYIDNDISLSPFFLNCFGFFPSFTFL